MGHVQSPEIPTSSPQSSFDLLHSAAAHLLDLGSARPPAPVHLHQHALLDHDDDNANDDDTVMPTTGCADFAEDQPASLNASPASDGIFIPGSAYLEFHSTLRNHTFQAARSTFPSRCGTPERPPTRHGHHLYGEEQGLASDVPEDEGPIEGSGAIRVEGTASSAVPTPGFVELTQQQEFELWKNWVDEIAPWVSTRLHEKRAVFFPR